MSELKKLQDELLEFAKARDWEQFHCPKNLAMALIVEAAELVEHFQWLTNEQSNHLSEETRELVRYEMADVLIYLLRLSERLDIDLLDAARQKMVLNNRRYPVEKARGSSRKYTEYQD